MFEEINPSLNLRIRAATLTVKEQILIRLRSTLEITTLLKPFGNIKYLSHPVAGEAW